MRREEVLDTARKAVCGERDKGYGTPEDNFGLIARLWSEYMGVSFTAKDVSMLMVLLKVARIKFGTVTADSFVDIAGYAACGGEIETGTNPAEEERVK